MESMGDKMLLAGSFHVHSSVPKSYVQPLESRPGSRVIASSVNKTIPVIDLGGLHLHDHHRVDTINHILKASEDYGFFQVINHGVSKDLMEEAQNIFKEFHAMPCEEKVNECTKDPNGSFKIYTSAENYKTDGIHYWKDTLSHPCPPSGENIKYWPHKPYKYRLNFTTSGEYTRQVGKLGQEILEMLCEGLGLREGYFSGGLSESPVITAHHYPPCPEPSLTLGVAKHRDPSLITILLQEEHVRGLQVLKDDEWIEIEPIPNAFVINIGLLLQIISNGRLIGSEHQVVTNSSTARTSVIYFIYPSFETVIEPSKDLVINGTTPPIYRSISFGEFRRIFYEKGSKVEEELHA